MLLHFFSIQILQKKNIFLCKSYKRENPIFLEQILQKRKTHFFGANPTKKKNPFFCANPTKKKNPLFFFSKSPKKTHSLQVRRRCDRQTKNGDVRTHAVARVQGQCLPQAAGNRPGTQGPRHCEYCYPFLPTVAFSQLIFAHRSNICCPRD